jgi:hypothetical protein
VPCLAAVAFACGDTSDDVDTSEEGLTRYGGLREKTPEACAVLRLANEADEATLDAFLDARGARAIVGHRGVSGAQIKTMLEQQWSLSNGVEKTNLLQVSSSVAYSWDGAMPIGSRLVASTLMIDGALVQDTSEYRITVIAFLADGGDGFAILKNGTARTAGGPRSRRAPRILHRASEPRPAEHEAHHEALMSVASCSLTGCSAGFACCTDPSPCRRSRGTKDAPARSTWARYGSASPSRTSSASWRTRAASSRRGLGRRSSRR